MGQVLDNDTFYYYCYCSSQGGLVPLVGRLSTEDNAHVVALVCDEIILDVVRVFVLEDLHLGEVNPDASAGGLGFLVTGECFMADGAVLLGALGERLELCRGESRGAFLGNGGDGAVGVDELRDNAVGVNDSDSLAGVFGHDARGECLIGIATEIERRNVVAEVPKPELAMPKGTVARVVGCGVSVGSGVEGKGTREQHRKNEGKLGDGHVES